MLPSLLNAIHVNLTMLKILPGARAKERLPSLALIFPYGTVFYISNTHNLTVLAWKKKSASSKNSTFTSFPHTDVWHRYSTLYNAWSTVIFQKHLKPPVDRYRGRQFCNKEMYLVRNSGHSHVFKLESSGFLWQYPRSRWGELWKIWGACHPFFTPSLLNPSLIHTSHFIFWLSRPQRLRIRFMKHLPAADSAR